MPTMEIRNIWEAAKCLANGKADAVISLGEETCKGFSDFTGPKLHLNFTDSIPGKPMGERAATSRHIQYVLELASSLEKDSHLLIHCWQGIGRSTAVGGWVGSLCVAGEPGPRRFGST